MRERTCVYEVDAGMTRREGMKRKQQALQENIDSFQALYDYLQSRNRREANALFERIRNGATLESTLEFIKSQESASTPPAIDPSLAWSQQIHNGNLLLEDEPISAADSDVAAQAIREGLDCFFRYLGTMFPVFTREEAQEIMRTFTEPSPKEYVTPDHINEKKIACGELSAICAVAFQYDRQTSPSGDDACISTPFYGKARLYLGYIMEHDPLRAMRICCCLGIYNAIMKPSLAVSYTGMLPKVLGVSIWLIG
jgi:hypothetical protein